MARDLKGYSTRFQNAAQAEKYALRFASGTRDKINQREQRAVQKIFAQLHDCNTVLDVPSGAGRLIGALGQQNRTVIEIDIAHEILIFARQQAASLGIQALFVQGDASCLPLAGGAVDAILCNRLLHHILPAAERAVVLRELHRVSRRYVVASFFDYHSFGAVRRFLKLLKGRRPAYQLQPTHQQFCAEVAQCGFRIIREVPTGPLWVAEKYLVLEKV